MPAHTRIRRRAASWFVVILALLTVAGCSDDQAPEPLPDGISVVSGDDQYTRKGTQLEEPVVVRVLLETGAPAPGVEVQFRVTQGGGSLSRTVATTDNSGRTSVKWTLGPGTGANAMSATVAGTNHTATATATSSEYYCPEEDPAFTQKFFSTGDLMMLTRESIHTAGMAGLVHFQVNSNGTFTGVSFANYAEGSFINVVRDCVFAANGDLFIAWSNLNDEIVKVASDGSVSHFATLHTDLGVPAGAELAMTPNGVLVGCDARGPFYVTCRDTLYRFEDAVFSGTGRDAANHDALACDPGTGDVYFIYKSDRRLYRIPFDGSAAGTKSVVPPDVALDFDVSDEASGMVVDGTDGAIYILVESAGTKSIVRVAGGTLTTVYDFFDRGAGAAAGIQSDLAIDRSTRWLYTLDTLNNQILLYSIATDQLVELDSDGDPFSASDNGSGEPIGLDVIAGP